MVNFMAIINRYDTSPILMFGKKYGTSLVASSIRDGIKQGRIRFDEIVLPESQRLDILAGEHYGDGRLYWIIAAASNIGWVPQAPPGTIIKIPVLDDVVKILNA